MDLHAAAREVVERNGWTLVSEIPPDLPDAPTRLQIEVRTPFLQLAEDVVLRIRPDRVGALLDIRSASRVALPDLSGNADRIRDLFRQIDEVLLETYGDIASEPVLEAEETVGGEGDGAALSDLSTDLGEGTGRVRLPPFKPFVPDAAGDAPPAEGPLDEPAPAPANVPQ